MSSFRRGGEKALTSLAGSGKARYGGLACDFCQRLPMHLGSLMIMQSWLRGCCIRRSQRCSSDRSTPCKHHFHDVSAPITSIMLSTLSQAMICQPKNVRAPFRAHVHRARPVPRRSLVNPCHVHGGAHHRSWPSIWHRPVRLANLAAERRKASQRICAWPVHLQVSRRAARRHCAVDGTECAGSACNAAIGHFRPAQRARPQPCGRGDTTCAASNG